MNEIPKKSLLVIIMALGRREGGKSRIGFKHSSRLVRNCVMHNNKKRQTHHKNFKRLLSLVFYHFLSRPSLPSPQAMAARKKRERGKEKVVVSAQFPRQKFLPPTLHQLRPKKKKTKARKGIRDWQLRGQKKREEEGLSIFLHVVVAESLPSPPPRSVPQLRFYHERGLAGGGRRGGRRKSLTPVKREEEGGKASSSWYPTSSDAGFPRKPPQTAP